MNLENEALSANQREWTKIRKELEELRSIRDDLDVLRSENKRYLEKVSLLCVHPSPQKFNLFFRYEI